MTGDAVRQLLAEIQQRAERATAGPWEVYVGADLMVLHARSGGGYDQIASTGSGADLLRDSDAAFIAEARSDVPRLVAALTAVLDLHQPVLYNKWTRVTENPADAVSAWCAACRKRITVSGCPTYRAVAAALEEQP